MVEKKRVVAFESHWGEWMAPMLEHEKDATGGLSVWAWGRCSVRTKGLASELWWALQWASVMEPSLEGWSERWSASYSAQRWEWVWELRTAWRWARRSA